MPESFDLIVDRSRLGRARRRHARPAATTARAWRWWSARRWGGSCPNVACKPTKAYLVVADLLHDINTLAGNLGIEVGPASANLARIKARKDSLLTSQEQWVENLERAGIATYPGEATLVDAHTVRAGDDGASVPTGS